MMAREASTEIDAVYTNPAGTSLLSDGFHFSFTNQSAFQTRTVTSTNPIFALNGGDATKTFEGKASAPIIPSLQAVYKKGDWALSGSIAVVGGGGKATFDLGLPSFEVLSGSAVGVVNQLTPMTQLKANQYSVEQHMEGSNFIYGAQLGGAYTINEMFSAYVGFRLNIAHNNYEGYLRNLKLNLTPASSDVYSPQLVDASAILTAAAAAITDPVTRNQVAIMSKASSAEGARLSSAQNGWGVAPILGVNFNYQQRLNIGLKYEFKTAIDVENNTKIDDTGLYSHGVNTPYDVPALFTAGASYKIIPAMQVSLGYHHFFDSDAKMSNDKQKYAGSTNEYLAGIEYKINRLFLISAGGQITNYGLSDEFQRDLSFSCDSYSLGFGGAVNVSENVRLNIGYFWTTYADYTVNAPDAAAGKLTNNSTIKDVYSRTNKVFVVGVDFRF
ncbi:membrane protein [Bacteroidia bacterium]|nr:membrane protein [Bacteroidia bacterium]